MKINIHIELKNMKGEIYKINGKNATIKMILEDCLGAFSSKIPKEISLTRYLGCKIYEVKDKWEIEQEHADFLKKVVINNDIGYYSFLIGQIVEEFEKKE